MKTVIGEQISVLFCPRKKKTGEYVTERYELTEDIFEAIGWGTKEDCLKDIKNMDFPKEWEVVQKVVCMMMFK